MQCVRTPNALSPFHAGSLSGHTMRRHAENKHDEKPRKYSNRNVLRFLLSAPRRPPSPPCPQSYGCGAQHYLGCDPAILTAGRQFRCLQTAA
eukprot:6153675-Pyramimonas_sp.AAC.1